MLSAQCQSDEDWHAGKLSFIFNVSAWEQGFTTSASLFPFPPLHFKRQDIIHTSSQPGQSEGERKREREGEREGEREREKVREGWKGGGEKRERERRGAAFLCWTEKTSGFFPLCLCCLMQRLDSKKCFGNVRDALIWDVLFYTETSLI